MHLSSINSYRVDLRSRTYLNLTGCKCEHMSTIVGSLYLRYLWWNNKSVQKSFGEVFVGKMETISNTDCSY